MKILMIAPEPILEPRGTPISVYQRLQGLATLGHSVDLVTYHLGTAITLPGVTVYRTPPLSFIKEIPLGPSLRKLLLDMLLLIQAIILLSKKPYDAIHSHEEAAFFSNLLAAFFGVPHLYDMHSSLPQQLNNFKFWNSWPFVKLFELLERWTINACDAIITIDVELEARVKRINRNAKQMLIENMAVEPDSTIGIHSPVEQLRQQFGLQSKLPIVYVGSFEPYQGLGLLLDSAQLVLQQHPEAVFILVGGKTQQVAYWQEQANQRKIAQNTIFTGTIPLDEVHWYLDLAEILVSPRVNGTSVPLKLYTYLWSGKPIVATNVPAHTVVVNCESSVLVEPTPMAFAQGLLLLIRNPEVRKQIGLQAKQLSETRYGRHNYLARLDQIYQSIQPKKQIVLQPSHPKHDIAGQHVKK